ncbi:MAG: hypothetical protein JXA42_21965 [Anaerolineales bacterium]|nr:hypothetical protein [Anaerolineales bacterium]
MWITKRLRLLGLVLLAPALLLGLMTAFLTTRASRAASTLELHVCPSCAYTTIQEAVDAANPGATIKVAGGTYTDVHNLIISGYPHTQVVNIDRNLTIEGGYTVTNWTTPDPANNPTVLDAEGKGRVFRIYEDIYTKINLRLCGLQIKGGDAAKGGQVGPGGGIFGRKTNLEIENCQLMNNTASSDGGGIYMLQGQVSVTGSLLQQNIAIEDGAGICVEASPITLYNSQLISNNSQSRGGGLYVLGGDLFVTAVDNLFQDNYAGLGGGALYMAYAGGVLTDNDFTGNSSCLGCISIDGGALRADYPPSLEISGGSFTGNQSGGRGGAVNIIYSDAVTVTGVLMKNNLAGNEGGAVYISYITGTMQNNAIVNNQAGAHGSGLFASSSTLDMYHNTISNNSGGDGSGLYAAHNESNDRLSYLELFNTIVAGQAMGVFADAGDMITLNTTLWHDNTTKYSGPVSHSNDQDGDPAFAPDGYHITSQSAAIENGNPDYTPQTVQDIDGDPRPMWSSFDIGADEYPFQARKLLSMTSELHSGDTVSFSLVINNYSPFTYTLTITDLVPSCLAATGSTTWTATLEPNSVWGSGLISLTVAAGSDGDCTNSMTFTTLEGPQGGASNTIFVIRTITTTTTQNEGGKLDITEGEQIVVEIRVPSGAVTETTELVYTTMADPVSAPANMLFAGRAFDFSAYRDGVLVDDFSFETGITVTLHYTDDDVVGLDEDTLMLYYWTGSEWSTVGITRVAADPVNNTVSYWLTHLTEFAQFGLPAEYDYRIFLPLVIRY